MTKSGRWLVAATTIGALTLTGCSSDETPMQEPLDTSTPAADTQTEAPSEEPAAADGTRENPIPVNTLTQYAPDSAWSFAVGETDADAWTSTIQQFNEFNPAPAEGESFIMAPFHLELSGDAGAEGADPVQSLEISYVTAGGVTYESDFFGDACGLFPNPFTDLELMYPGASTDSNICAAVPTDEVSGGAWRVGSFVQPSSAIFLEGAE